MDYEKFTVKSREALLLAQEEVIKHKHQEILPLHLLKALVSDNSGLVYSILNKLNIDSSSVERSIEKSIK